MMDIAELKFTKMHGLGNDFVVLDARTREISMDVKLARAIADRRLGIGCDQILIMEPATIEGADLFMRILNADGGEVDACGNGTRCVASLVMAETGADEVNVQTNTGILKAMTGEEGYVAVNMGPVNVGWQDIPLAEEADTLTLDLSVGDLSDPVAVNVGNPHAVFFVEKAADVALEELGPEIENHPMFPERTNVEIAQMLPDGSIRLRVWERGVGITRACGTGACATLVAAHRREYSGRNAIVILDGGALGIEWQDDNDVILVGPVATSFTGTLDKSLLG
ncbi:MAG: diaminopimelate epimerase [Rhodospirillales bacterium]|nr:diaminopimelate epimerase [Alphaproteobacteria bacterium]MBL6947136.1 diaminopimelate epimerase [Rhodospirillales bacterium]